MSNLQRIIYLSKSEYETLLANNTITKNGRTIIYNANDLYITPDSSEPEYYTSTSDFPPIGDSEKFYIDTTNNTLYYWKDSDGYIQFSAPVFSTIGSASNWNPGEMTNLSVDQDTPSLIISNGVEPSLTISQANVVTNIEGRSLQGGN